MQGAIQVLGFYFTELNTVLILWLKIHPLFNNQQQNAREMKMTGINQSLT